MRQRYGTRRRSIERGLGEVLIFDDLNGLLQCKIEHEPFLAFDPYLNLIFNEQ